MSFDVFLIKYNFAELTNNKLNFNCMKVFKSAPPTPPSGAQETSKQPNPLESSPFLHSIKRLVTNMNYVLLLISYGMNVGVFYAISTLLNQVSAVKSVSEFEQMIFI